MSFDPRPPKRGPRPPSFTPPGMSISESKKGPRPPSSSYDASLVAKVLTDEKSQKIDLKKEKGRRMSDLLREDKAEVDVDKIFHDDEYHDLDNERPKNWQEKVKLMYKRKIHEKKVMQRVLLCALAVSLLWASSLGVCRLIVETFIPSPTYDQMEESVLRLKTTVVEQGLQYEGCVNDAFGKCLTNYRSSSAQEVTRVSNLQNLQFAILDNNKVLKASCAQDHDIVVTGLNILRTPGVNGQNALILTDYLYPPDEYSTVDCSPVEAISKQQLVARDAVNIGQDTADASNVAVNNLTSQLDARIAYDQNYFHTDLPTFWDLANAEQREELMSGDEFAKSMNLTFTQLEACLSNTGEFNGTTCPNNTRVMEKFQIVYNSFDADFQALQEQANQYKDDYESIAATAAQIAAIGKQISKLSGASAFFDQINFDTSPWNIAGVDFSDFDASFLDGDLLGDLGISFEDLERRRQEALQEMYDALRENSAGFDELAQEIQDAQDKFNDAMVDDYHPPPVDYNTTNADYQQQANDLADAMAADLGYVRNTSADAERIDAVIDHANESAANLLTDVQEREWDFFGYPDYTFEAFKVGIADFSHYAVLFDSVWRVMQSVLLVKKYWSISGILTPPADVRADSGTLYKEKKSLPQMLAMLLTHPAVQLVNTAFWISLLTLVIFLAYEPLYTEYVQGCIQHSARDISNGEDDGTMIYRNILTITTNYANADGDAAVTENIDHLNLERELSCRDYFQASALQRIKINDTYVKNNEDFTVLTNRYNLFHACVDWDEIDTKYDTINTLGIELASIINRQECRSPLPSVNTGDVLLHNCTNILGCENPCGGVNINIMQTENHKTACTVEWGLHSYFLTFLFSAAIYICVNISRFYFMRAVIAVWWKQITVDIYSYMGSCTKMGTVIPPKKVTEEGESFRVVIKEALDKSLKKFARGGYVELAYAFFINLPWIVFMSIITKDLKYSNR